MARPETTAADSGRRLPGELPAAGLLLAALLACAAPRAAEQTEVIELRARTAEEMVPLLRPLLAPGGALTGRGTQLIVRTTPENLAELRRVLAQLDRAPRQLLITVLQGEAAREALREAEASASIGVGERGRVVLGEPAPGAGDGVQLRLRSTESSREAEDAQRVRVLEGNAALIRVGQSVPVGSVSVTRGPHGREVTKSIDYRDLDSGFVVVPRIAGERVTLEIRAQRQSASPGGGGRFETAEVQTTVSGRLGEWIELGGSRTQSSAASGAGLERSAQTASDDRRVILKVEEIR